MTRVADLFCGAGGETTGIVQALGAMGLRYDLAAVNHWQVAIDTHKRNHPQSRAYCQDLATLNPLDVFGARDRVDLLWASPECTHHSIARGGRPRSEQGRASAWLILKWLSELYVRRVILENVPEFVNWGPLGSDSRPLASGKGATFAAFVAAIQSLGYRVEWRLLCAADYGDPTTRTRLFVQAVRGRGRIEWPEPTHSREPDLFGLQPWVPARNVIDWSIRGESILNRRRPLAPATLRRIEAGIRRYWGEWAEPFLVVLRGTSVARGAGEPLPTVTAGGGHFGLVEPFLVPHYGERPGQEPRTHAIDEPAPTIPASGGGKFGVVEPFMLQLTHGGRTRGAGEPLPTITTAHRGEVGVIQPFLLHQMSWGRPRTTDEPVPIVVGQGTHHLIEGFILPHLGYHHHEGQNGPRDLGLPLQTVTASHGAGHVVEPFLVRYNGTGGAEPVRVPLGALTTRDRYGLVEGVPVGLDITFRMLQPHELAAAQGFPRGYQFAGNKTEIVKQIGNAVPVGTAEALTLATLGAA